MATIFSYFDLFSQQIQFNSNLTDKKKTKLGVFLSFFIISSTLYYFIYLTQLYFSNQIDPKFRSQNFVTKDDVIIDITEETFGFQLAPQYSIDLIQQYEKANKTFIVFLAFYVVRNSSHYEHYQLDIVKCQNPELSGFYCIDLQNIPNFNITVSHSKSIYSQIAIFPYRCQDVDAYKKFVPDNCASKSEIDNYLGDFKNTLNFKIQVSQLNTTSKQIEKSYVNNRMPALGNFLTLAELKVKKQITSVKQGFFFQSESSFSSPITAQFASTSIDYKSFVQLTGQKMISQTVVVADESVQCVNIEYPPFTEVLALCNSFFALLMILGVFGKLIAQRLIRQDMLLLFLQNIYLETYERLLKHNNLVQFENRIQPNEMTKSIINEEKEYSENNQQIQIPMFKQLKSLSVFKQGQSFDQKQSLSHQQNLFISDNQSSFSYTNMFFQPTQELQDFCNRQSRDSPLQSFQSNMLKKNIGNSTSHQLEKQQQKQTVTTNTQNRSSQEESIKNIRKNQDNIVDGTIIQKLQSLQNKNIKEKAQILLFKTKLFCRDKFLETKGLNKQILLKIEKDANESLDFYKVYKDILFLKKAIMILFSKDQLAALQLVGYSHEFLSINLEEEIKKVQQKESVNKSHLEEQHVISQSEELQGQQINKFLQRYQSQQNLSQVDNRIYSSMNLNQNL